MSRRRCVRQCEGNFPLYGLPKVDADVRDRWLKCVYTAIPQQYSPNLFVCSLHFTEDCFLNRAQFTAGFSKRLLLKVGAVPTLLVKSEDTQPSSSQHHPDTIHWSTKDKFHDKGCQTKSPPTVSEGTQSVASPKMVSVRTQLSMGTLRDP
ncbi:hypothetical protein NHX12_004854, partial [Muraenolepis orangiensis]